jgi:hypothetical protein
MGGACSTNGGEEKCIVKCHPLLGNVFVNNFPRRQILGKQYVSKSRNNRTNVYISLLGNNLRANGQVRQLSRDLFSMSAPYSVLSNKTVNISTILGVFYGVRADGL